MVIHIHPEAQKGPPQRDGCNGHTLPTNPHERTVYRVQVPVLAFVRAHATTVNLHTVQDTLTHMNKVSCKTLGSSVPDRYEPAPRQEKLESPSVPSPTR